MRLSHIAYHGPSIGCYADRCLPFEVGDNHIEPPSCLQLFSLHYPAQFIIKVRSINGSPSVRWRFMDRPSVWWWFMERPRCGGCSWIAPRCGGSSIAPEKRCKSWITLDSWLFMERPRNCGGSWIAHEKTDHTRLVVIHESPSKNGGGSWNALGVWWWFMDRPRKNRSHSTSGDSWIAHETVAVHGSPTKKPITLDQW